MMKKILTGLALAAAGVLCAQENAIGNGSFEQILKKQKSNSYIMAATGVDTIQSCGITIYDEGGYNYKYNNLSI